MDNNNLGMTFIRNLASPDGHHSLRKTSEVRPFTKKEWRRVQNVPGAFGTHKLREDMA